MPCVSVRVRVRVSVSFNVIQAVLFADRTNLSPQKFIFALLQLAEKPAIKFHKPARKNTAKGYNATICDYVKVEWSLDEI